MVKGTQKGANSFNNTNKVLLYVSTQKGANSFNNTNKVLLYVSFFQYKLRLKIL